MTEGVITNRKPAMWKGKPVPGYRCATHHRERRALTRTKSRDTRLEALYGLTRDEYEAVKAYQGGVCAICQRATGAVRALAVDHDHATGIIRGTICKYDNRLLGHARDSIEFFERCIDYLQNPPAVTVLGERIAPIEVARLTLNGDE